MSQVSDRLSLNEDTLSEFKSPKNPNHNSMSSFGVNSKISHHRSLKLLPPKSNYYYQSNYKNANRLKVLEEDLDDDTSDEDCRPTIYPEDRFLSKQYKI